MPVKKDILHTIFDPMNKYTSISVHWVLFWLFTLYDVLISNQSCDVITVLICIHHVDKAVWIVLNLKEVDLQQHG